MNTAMNITTFGPIDERSRQQLENCVTASGEPVPAVLCADHHPGYSMPIGGVLALKGAVIPAGVGYDIIVRVYAPARLRRRLAKLWRPV